LGAAYPDMYMVEAFSRPSMMFRIMESVRFIDERNGRPQECPHRVTSIVKDKPRAFPVLAGILEVPTITPSGALLSKPGYDAGSGFYCAFDKRLSNHVPDSERVTKARADAALAWIKDTMFEGFPFAGSIDKAGAVSLLLTAFVRRFLDKSPGYLVNATIQASGKSTLIDMVFQGAFGRPAPASSYTSDQTEMSKTLVSHLRSGGSGICFDNIAHGESLDGEELAKVITQPTYSSRLLGGNSLFEGPTNTLICFSGNMVSLCNDFTTRVLTINLAPNVENPENTKFCRRDIDEWHDENRHRIVRAVLTILIAWHKFGKQEFDDSGFIRSRMPQWDEAVRKPLEWLGEPSLMKVFAANKREDPQVEQRADLLAALYGEFQEASFTVKQVAEFSCLSGFEEEESSVIRDAVAEMFGEPREVTHQHSKHIANSFRMFKGRVFDGLRLEKVEPSLKTTDTGEHDANGQPVIKMVQKSKASAKWRVVKVVPASSSS